MSKMSDFDIGGSTLLRYKGNDSNVVIPEGVLVIASCAFRECKSVVSVTFPASLFTIRNDIFGECESLESCIFADAAGWTELPAWESPVPYRRIHGNEIDVTDPKAAARMLLEKKDMSFFKKLVTPQTRPRFVSPSTDSAEGVYVAQGQCFAPYYPDSQTYLALLEQAKAFFVRWENTTWEEDDYNHFHSVLKKEERKDRPLTDILAPTDCFSERRHNGDILVVDGEVKGAILYVGIPDGTNYYEYGRICLNKTPVPEKEDRFVLFYADGSTVGEDCFFSTNYTSVARGTRACTSFSLTTTPESDFYKSELM